MVDGFMRPIVRYKFLLTDWLRWFFERTHPSEPLGAFDSNLSRELE